MIVLTIVSTLMVISAGTSGAVPRDHGDLTVSRTEIQEMGVDYINAPSISRANLTDVEKKLSTDLLQLLDRSPLPDGQNRGTLETQMEQSRQFHRANNLVYVYVYLIEPARTQTIESYVWEVTDRDESAHIAVAWVMVNDLERLASLEEVRTIRTVMPPLIQAGSATTEGDAIHRTSNVRATYTKNGSGVKVGIISNGVDHLADAQSSGDLPAGVTVMSNTVGGEEGTAMLEIVHDMVPGADLYFHDCGGNTVAFNDAIDSLIAAGCDVVCDDIGWITQPFFEDGIIATHLTDVLTSNNIIYVSSAGNAGQRHYQGDYCNIPGSTQHDFSGGGTEYYLDLQMSAGSDVRVVLQWNDPFGSSGNDYDLRLYSYGSSSYVAMSEDVQDGDDDPLESISYVVPAGTPTGDYAIVVDRWSGAGKTLEVFIYPSSDALVYPHNIDAIDSIFGHAAVPGAIAVGAIAANDAGNDDIEDFSSRGPVTISHPYETSRAKPNIVGIDGVAVTGAGGFSNPFYGTSAAAPHIAAIATQLWGAFPAKTGDEICDMLYNSAVDLGSAGCDNTYGYGRADALDAYTWAAGGSGEVVQLTGAQSGDISWDKSNFGGFCYNMGDGACVGTETLTIADGTLEGPNSDRTVDKDRLTYTTQPISQEYKLHSNLGLTVDGGSGYWIEFWMGEVYVAIDGRADKLTKPLVEFNSTDIKTLAVGEEWDIGGGFALEAKQIDLGGEKVWLCLYKDGSELDSEVIDSGSSDLQDRAYTYTEDVAGEVDVPIFSCYVSSVFRGTCSNLAQVRYVFLIDGDAIEIDTGEGYDSMEVVSASSSGIVLANRVALGLAPDSTVEIMNNMSFEVADNDGAIEFYPHLTRDEPPVLSGSGGFVSDDYRIGSQWNLSEDYSLAAKDVDIGEHKARIALLKNGGVVDERILTKESEAPVNADSYYSYVMDGTEIINATLKNVLNGMVELTKVYQHSEVNGSRLVNNKSHSFGGSDLDHITVTPAGPLTMNVTETQAFNATCYNGTTELTGITVTWNSSNTTVGTITNGVFTAAANGTTSITATAQGVTSNAVSVTVGEAGLVGDVNGDGTVNYVDLGILGATYGLSLGDAGYNAAADLNGDNTVNYIDLGMLGAHYGESI